MTKISTYFCQIFITITSLYMSTVTSRVSPYLLMIVLALAAIPYKIFAQTQATIMGRQDRGCTVLNVCGTISNVANAVDASLTTAASITPALATSTAALQVGFVSEVASGTRIKVRIGFASPNTLSLAVANNTVIKTYAAPTPGAPGQPDQQGQELETIPLGLSTVSANTFIDITFTATIAFQYLELRTGSTANVNTAYSALLYNVATTTDTGTGTTITSTPLPVELVTFTGKSRAATV